MTGWTSVWRKRRISDTNGWLGTLRPSSLRQALQYVITASPIVTPPPCSAGWTDPSNRRSSLSSAASSLLRFRPTRRDATREAAAAAVTVAARRRQSWWDHPDLSLSAWTSSPHRRHSRLPPRARTLPRSLQLFSPVRSNSHSTCHNQTIINLPSPVPYQRKV